MPPLSVVIAVREGLEEVEAPLAALLPQARATGTEVIVVGPVGEPAPEPVRVVRVNDDDIYRLRLVGVEAARGEIVAIGEDHAVPRSDWSEAVIRAHAEHAEKAAVIGCLVNGTDSTFSGRGNFFAFAAPFQPPMPDLPRRPPPVSTLSFKRGVLDECHGRLGHLESVLIPRLFEEAEMAVDDRILVDHHQDHGIRWSVVNAFHSARASYGYAARGVSREERRNRARWSIRNWPPLLFDEARAVRQASRAELAMVAVNATAAGFGGAVGSLFGPGRSPRRVA